MPHSPIFCAIDIAEADVAFALAQKIAPHVGGLKLGLEYFIANGPEGVRRMGVLGLPIFLDLKLHDIPNTVAATVREAARLHVSFLTIHTAGGVAMMRAAVEAAAGRVKLLGVTVLTSLDDNDLVEVGQIPPSYIQVELLAMLAQKSGLDGVICSPLEIVSVRQRVGSNFILTVPGIRPAMADPQDQKRTLTPAAAVKAGATWLVIGRPITGAADPVQAAIEIAAEL